MDVKVDISNNGDIVLDALDSAILAALEEIGIVAEGNAKEICPVDTGRLRNSITHAIDADDKSVQIGTNVEYAAYVELGTSRMKAQPYLRPAAQQHVAEYTAILQKHVGR